MSRPAVESTLFRARRRLTEEYDELVTGERCVRVQAIIADAAERRARRARPRRLARHVSYCQPCRREARAAGLDAGLLAQRPLRERMAAKVAAFFPFPALLRARRDGGGSGADAGWASQLPMFSDHAAAGGAKLAAAAAVLVAGFGAGISTHGDSARTERATASEQRSAGSMDRGTAGRPASAVTILAPAGSERAGGNALRRESGSTRGTVLSGSRDVAGVRGLDGGASDQGAAGVVQPGGHGTTGAGTRGGDTATTPASTPASGGGGATPKAGRDDGGGPAGQTPRVTVPKVQAPAVNVPSASVELNAGGSVDQAAGTVQSTGQSLQSTGSAELQSAADQATGAVGGTSGGVLGDVLAPGS